MGLVLGQACLGDLEAYNLLGLNCIPQNSYVEVLTPSTSENGDLEIGSLQMWLRCSHSEEPGPHSSVTGVLVKGGGLDREMPREMKAATGDVFAGQWTPRLPVTARSQGEARDRLSVTALGGANPDDTLVLDFWPP